MVVQHLAVLRGADLVVVEVRGRKRVNHLNVVPIQRIHDRWVSRFAQPWVAALVGLKETVERRRDGADRKGKAVG